MRTRKINSKTAIKVVIFNGLFLFVNVAQSFDNMQQKMFAKFFGYLNLSWRGCTKQCIVWGPEIIKIMEKINYLADLYIKVHKVYKVIHNISTTTCNIKFFHHADFWWDITNYYSEDQKLKDHMKRCFRKVRLSIVWNIDDYQKKCSFNIFDIYGGVQQRDW